MARHIYLVYAMFFVWIAGVYAFVTFGLLSASLDNLTPYQMHVLFMGTAVFHIVFTLVQALGGACVRDYVVSTSIFLAALASCVIALASLAASIIALILTEREALIVVDVIRNAGAAGAILSTLVALITVRVSIERTVNKALLEMQNEATCA